MNISVSFQENINNLINEFSICGETQCSNFNQIQLKIEKKKEEHDRWANIGTRLHSM